MRRAIEIRRRILLAWRAFATAERRSAWHLLSRGFLYRREPAFINGKKPDFLTFGRSRMWVEVKELDPPVSQTLLDTGWEELTRRLSRFVGKCRVDVWIAPGFNAQIAKRVTHLLSQAVKTGIPVNRELYIAVPLGDTDEDVVRLEWRRRNGIDVQLVAFRTADGTYSCPPAASPADWAANLRIWDGPTCVEKSAHTVLQSRRPARVSLRVQTWTGSKVLYSVGNAETHDVRTVDRLREVIDRANDQLKNGQKHRPLPGILIVYFDHIGGGDYGDVLRACLGDLTIAIDPRNNSANETYYGRNGVFRADKNTAISAIIYRSRHYKAVSLLNAHALYPVDPKCLDGTIYWVDSSGTVKSN